MPRPRFEVKTGDVFGKLTVTGEPTKDKTGHLLYPVRCNCGREFKQSSHLLFHGRQMCADCIKPIRARKLTDSYIGKTYGIWDVLEYKGRDHNGKRLYRARCRCCHNDSVKCIGAITRSDANYCINCPPNYHFVIRGKVAEGTLLDGTKFLIDAEDVNRVSRKHWKLHKGYIQSSERRDKNLKLHNFLLDFDVGNTIVDHINHDPLDCRKANMRIVTMQQNSMNRSIGCNNTSGFVGVTYDRRRRKYVAKICLNNHTIYLGGSEDKIECAQMYNLAAKLLFREYVGHVNTVPEPSDIMKWKIYKKCLPYMEEADEATQPCGLYLYEEMEEAVNV